MNFNREDLKQRIQQAFSRTHLGLAVSPTEKCNFRCTYCYEDFEQGRMSAQVQDRLKLAISNRAKSLKTFSLSWFGGEPLVARDIVTDITSYSISLLQPLGVRIAPVTIATNGYLLDGPTLESLVAAGVTEYMISLDGTETTHDKTRKLANGSGTFAAIYRNLQEARRLPVSNSFTFHLRLHLHSGNLQSQLQLAQMLANDFGNDERFQVFATPVNDHGGDGIKSMTLIDDATFKQVESDIAAAFRPQNPWSAEVVGAGRAPVCYAAKFNHFFVRPDGRLSKCTVAMDRPDNVVGQIMPDGTLLVDERLALEWSYGFKTESSLDLRCPLVRKPVLQPITFHKVLQ